MGRAIKMRINKNKNNVDYEQTNKLAIGNISRRIKTQFVNNFDAVKILNKKRHYGRRTNIKSILKLLENLIRDADRKIIKRRTNCSANKSRYKIRRGRYRKNKK